MKYLFAALALACATVPCIAAPAADISDPPWTAGLADEQLVAVDDSTLTLTPMEGRLTLDFTSHGGATQKTTFSFVSDKMGTVADDDSNGRPTGFFRQTDVGLEITYDDGRTASLFANVAEGLTMTRRGPGGESVCVSWYPKDHQFSAAEKRAAVDAYAQSLGIAEHEAPAARKSKSKKRAVVAAAPAGICSPPMKHAPKAQDIAVRKSDVHAIDATPTAPASVAATPSPPPAPEVVAAGSGASQCLSVEVQGAYVGFRNRCANDVQLVYCLEKGTDPAVTCGTGTKAGSVTASGFTGVLADTTAAEHDVRWVGCSGAPGEVNAQMDRADPPAGHCMKKGPQSPAS